MTNALDRDHFVTSFEDQWAARKCLFGRALRLAQQDPSYLLVRKAPTYNCPENDYALAQMGSLQGKRVLDLGCGLGQWAVYFALQGAEVSAVDLIPEQVEVVQWRAIVNKVADRIEAQVMDAGDLKYKDSSFDLVFGAAILHHLDAQMMRAAMCHVHRVLVPAGRGVFVEPVENSRAFEYIQQIVPAGYSKYGTARPSCLCRKEYKKYKLTTGGEDRALNVAILKAIGADFSDMAIKEFGLINRLAIGPLVDHVGVRTCLNTVDELLLRFVPFLRYLCRSVVVQYIK